MMRAVDRGDAPASSVDAVPVLPRRGLATALPLADLGGDNDTLREGEPAGEAVMALRGDDVASDDAASEAPPPEIVDTGD